MCRGIAIVCCGFDTFTFVVNTMESIIITRGMIEDEIERTDNLKYECAPIEEKRDTRAEKALSLFHGNKYKNMGGCSKNVHRATNRNLIRNRNNI